jgi:glycosyltransferase involved in cell wall biosynthesis
MKIKILGLYPMQGNGGIASWTKKFLATFPDEEYKICPVNIAPDKDFTKFSGTDRILYGIKAIVRIRKDISGILKQNPDIQVMHITTGGGFGALRDNTVARICRKHGIKTIMHCRFGTIKEFYEGNKLTSWVFRKNLELYDRIWVLDRRSADFLRTIPDIKDKIELTPNSIEVPEECDLRPKSYKRVGFVGNIVPTKGIFELVEAISYLDNGTELFIVGQGLDVDINRIKTIAGEKLGKNIHLLGRLPNAEAVSLMETLDIIALPTYYAGEAFPISILEAMSRGKLVISCPRAAIPDMLTAIDGTLCGILVSDKDSKAIADSIEWCQDHNDVADEMCKKAYEKVKTAYRKEVVYEIYRENYRKLLQIDTDSNN